MKAYKKIFVLVLIAVLVFTAACGKKENEQTSVTQGRYVETDITPTEGYFYSFVRSDGTIVCYDQTLETKYESSDNGSTWSQSAGPALAGAISNCTQLSDGTLIAYRQSEGLIKITPDGGTSEFPIQAIQALEEGTEAMLSVFSAVSDDRLLISFYSGSFSFRMEGDGENGPSANTITNDEQGETSGGIIGSAATTAGPPIESAGPQQTEPGQGGGQAPQDERPGGGMNAVGAMAMNAATFLVDIHTGETVTDLSDSALSRYAAVGNTLYTVDNANAVHAYDLQDGSAKTGESRTLPSTSNGETGPGMMVVMRGGSGSALAATEEGVLYYSDDSGLHKVAEDGTNTLLMEADSYSFGLPNSSVQSIAALKNEAFIVLVSEGMRSKMYRYDYDAKATVDPAKTIAIWSLYDNSLVRATINAFMAKHPDATVTFEVALPEGTSLSEEDAIKNLNTALLSEGGPDILILDGCPIESYIRQGVLVDMEATVDTGSIFPELMAAYRDGGVYAVPTQFSVPVLMGSSADIAANDSLEKLVAAIVNGPDMPEAAQGGDPFTAIAENERAILGFDSTNDLFEVLWNTSSAAVVKDGALDKDALRQFFTAAKSISDRYQLTDEREERSGMVMSFSSGGGRVNRIGSGLMNYMAQRTVLGAATMDNIMFLQIISERDDAQLAPFPGIASGSWNASGVAGISADSKVIDLSSEFISLMISDTMQGSNYGSGFPVTASGFDAQIADINERAEQENRDPFTFDYAALVSKLTEPAVNDTVITKAIKAATVSLCSGDIDVEGAVNEVEQSIKNYLAERA